MPRTKRRDKPSFLTDQFHGLFDQVKVGDFVQLQSGPSFTRLGKVYGKEIHPRWGRSIRLKMEDFTFEEVNGFTTRGIGAYYLGGGFKPTWENVMQRVNEIKTNDSQPNRSY